MNFTRSLDIPLSASLRSTRKIPGKRETSALCRERAAADLIASAAMINANQRLRLETSAASWTMRAEMLQRVEDGFAQRIEAAAAKRVIGDPPATERTRL